MSDPQPFSGTFEQPDQNPAVGAFILVLLCGGLYVTIGGWIGELIGVFFYVIGKGKNLVFPSFTEPDFFSFLEEFYRTTRVPSLILTIVFEWLIFVGLATLLIRRWHTHHVSQYIQISLPKCIDLLIAPALGVLVVPVALLLSSWGSILFPGLAPFFKASGSFYRAESPSEWILLIVSIGITPAFCEEFFFRGYLLHTLQRVWPHWLAIVVSAILFSLFHRNFLGFITLFVVGMLLAVVYTITQNIFVSGMLHLAYNTTIILLENSTLESFPWYVVLCATAGVLVLLLLLGNIHKITLWKKQVTP